MATVMSRIRSGPSRKPCYLRFTNRTSRKLRIIWIDYNGAAVPYGILEPRMHFDIHTYEGHPWICEDIETKTRMLLNKRKVFYPSSCDQVQHQPNGNVMRCYLPVLLNNQNLRNPHGLRNDVYFGCRRQYVSITLPVLALVERSAEVVAMNIHSRSKSDVDSLEIPVELKNRLNSYFVCRRQP